MKRSIIVLLIIAIPLILFAEQDELFRNRGRAGSGASFINSVNNAYGISTGGILMVFGDTADAVFWNPAGLCQIEDSQLQLNGSLLSADRIAGSIGFAKLFGENKDKAFGITLLNSSVVGIDAYDSSDNPIGHREYFGNGLIFTFAKATEVIKLGFNVKVINEIMDKAYAWGGSVDFGIIFAIPLPILPKLGVTINNLPGFIKWDTEEEIHTIGAGYQIGLGYSFNEDTTKVGLNFSKDYGDEEVNVNIGVEVGLSSLIAVRFGYYRSNFSGGVGFRMGFLNVDYAYYNEQFLEMDNSSHFMSTTFHF